VLESPKIEPARDYKLKAHPLCRYNPPHHTPATRRLSCLEGKLQLRADWEQLVRSQEASGEADICHHATDAPGCPFGDLKIRQRGYLASLPAEAAPFRNGSDGSAGLALRFLRRLRWRCSAGQDRAKFICGGRRRLSAAVKASVAADTVEWTHEEEPHDIAVHKSTAQFLDSYTPAMGAAGPGRLVSLGHRTSSGVSPRESSTGRIRDTRRGFALTSHCALKRNSIPIRENPGVLPEGLRACAEPLRTA
jgi:hypothetical protein